MEYENDIREQKDKKSRFEVGQKASIDRIIYPEDVEKFAKLSGDFNSLHMNEDQAKESIFGQRVCHGMLVGSYISAVLGMHMPGEGTIYLEQDLKFLKPVYLNEKIEIIAEIIEIIENREIVRLKTEVLKENGTVAVSGVAKVKARLFVEG